MFPILKVEIQSAINYFKTLRTQTFISLMIILFLAIFILPFLLLSLFNFLLSADEPLLAPTMFIMSIMLLTILSLITVNRIVKDMFMNRNMQLYLTFPVTGVELLRAKFIMQLSTGILPIAVPLGLVTGAAFTFRYTNVLPLISSLIYFTLLSVVTLAASYVIVYLVTKVTSPKKVSEILTFIGGFAAVLPYFIITFGMMNIETVFQYLPDTEWLYNGVLYNITTGEFLIYSALGVIFAAVIFISLTYLVKDGFIKGWLSASGRTSKAGGKAPGVYPVRKALLMKDIHMTKRDFKEWSGILPQYLIPFLIYFVAFNPVAPKETVQMSMDVIMVSVSFTGTVIISLFVSAANTARDARHYDMTRTLPVGSSDVVAAKFMYNLITIVPVYIVLAIIVFIFTGASVVGLLYSSAFIILTATAVIPLGMLFGVKYPVVNRKKPTERLDTGASVIMSIVMVIIVFSTGALSNVFIGAGGGILHRMIGIVIIGLLILSLFTFFVIMKKVRNNYDRGLEIAFKE